MLARKYGEKLRGFVIVKSFLTFLYDLKFYFLALGEYTRCSRLLVDSKITLGFGGVLIVLISVTSSVGVYGYAGVKATLVIIEV